MAIAGIRAGKAFIELTLDDTGLQKQLRGIRRRFQRLARSLAQVGAGLTAVGATLSIPFIKAIKDAGDFQESLNLFQVIYKDLAESQREWLDALGDRTQRSTSELLEIAAQFGVIGNSIGLAGDELRDFSRRLVERTVDVGSLRNLPDQDVATRFASGLRGDVRSVERLGIILTKARIEAALLSKGIRFADATEAEKQLVRYEEILRQTVNAIGDAENTSSSFNNVLKGLRAEILDLGIAIGTQLLPFVTGFLNSLRESLQPLARFVGQNRGLVLSVTATIVGITTLGLALTGLGVASAVIAASIGAIGVVVSALASPIGILAAAVGTAGFAFGAWAIASGQLETQLKSLIDTVANSEFVNSILSAAFGSQEELEAAKQIFATLGSLKSQADRLKSERARAQTGGGELLGIKTPEIPLIPIGPFDAQIKAFREAQKDRVKVENEILQIRNRVRPETAIADEIARLNDLFAQGKIDGGLFAEAIDEARQRLKALQASTTFSSEVRQGFGALNRAFAPGSGEPAKTNAFLKKLLKETEDQTQILSRQGAWR